MSALLIFLDDWNHLCMIWNEILSMQCIVLQFFVELLHVFFYLWALSPVQQFYVTEGDRSNCKAAFFSRLNQVNRL
jgi:hypothetical protein